MKTCLSLFVLLAFTFCTKAQKQTFDVVSFALPKGWQQQQGEAGIQLSTTDKKTGAYAIVVMTKSMLSSATENENFNNDWLKLIKGSVKVNTEPTMQKPIKENGWDVISGNANYTDGTNTGVATLFTATGDNKVVSVVLMTNTKQYQNELSAFITSLELSKALQNSGNVSSAPSSIGETGKSPVIGLWKDNLLEKSGYVNGIAQYTAGYFRKEYTFNSNGTYVFMQKSWSAYSKSIYFVYETGIYTVNGNKLIITPRTGKNEEWGKGADGRTGSWGKLIKSDNRKLPKTTYTFDIKYYAGSQNTSLELYHDEPTERETQQNGNEVGAVRKSSYNLDVKSTPLITPPPGLKINTPTQLLSSNVNMQQANSSQMAGSASSPIVGKIWEGTSSEKFTGSGAMTGHYTGGFSSSQYQFNADGTYRFIDVLASFYTDTKTYKYETGTYSVSSNQLTIKPTKGQNEEWTKVGKTSNGNSDVTNRAINETWGKKIKTAARRLETYTYTFSIGKNGNQNALILQRNGSTEREGEGKISYYNETSPERSVKLPTEIK
ncbi:lipocalin family protein [Pedobacter sp. UC225_65]|uniref:lipocalin family protein n=1 Tax=Pedobacter sp. UC225_65 TaxID=3350173 RepID=UPI00367138AF